MNTLCHSQLNSYCRQTTVSVTSTYTSVIAIPISVIVVFLGEPIVRAVHGVGYPGAVLARDTSARLAVTTAGFALHW